MTYTHLSLEDVAVEFAAMARETRTTFGALDARQLNWRPNDTRWSVAQCFEHLLTSNALMFQSIDAALQRTKPATIWQRLPALPAISGRLLIDAVSPHGKRRHKAPSRARPATSQIDPSVVPRFIASQDEGIARVRRMTPGEAARTNMLSPFISFVAYSVLDGCRVIAAHQRRHFAQAQRVMEEPEFPR